MRDDGRRGRSSRGVRRWRVCRSTVVCGLVLCGCLATAGEVAAQLGIPGRGGLSRGEARYYASVMRGVDETVTAWGAAFSADDAESLAALYTSDAVLILPDGATLRGRDEIRLFFEERLGQLGRVTSAMDGLDASGRLAMVHGRLSASGRDGAEGWDGPVMTIYMRDGGQWFIRSQSLHDDEVGGSR